MYLLNNASQTQPVGLTHAEAVVHQFNEELKDALSARDWANAKKQSSRQETTCRGLLNWGRPCF